MSDLRDGSIHVWATRLDLPDAVLASLEKCLGGEEIRRAESYRRMDSKRRFIAARVFLRQILASYQQILPHEVQFQYEPNGKPWVNGGNGLEFNLSHSDDVACAAVARGRRLGIDVEVIREGRDLLGIAHRYFSPSEASRIELAKEADRARVFFAHWTCKEAYLKARGDGLLAPLDNFEVVVDLTGTDVDLKTADGCGLWSIRRLCLGEGLAVALAAEGDNWSVSSGWWPLIP